MSFATPPTSMPTESVESIVSAQLPMKRSSEPRRRTSQKSAAGTASTASYTEQ
ncbi:MAG: hypothetical protein SOX75_08450 [Candidatus Limivicinus sp.]|nr:hypothetical protein [Candidatus Limivicinus sp.]